MLVCFGLTRKHAIGLERLATAKHTRLFGPFISFKAVTFVTFGAGVIEVVLLLGN
jgi:hypothetical protein